jgi:CheY-like chemotaxis protein
MNVAGNSLDVPVNDDLSLPAASSNDTAWRHKLSEDLRTRLNAIIGFSELLGLDPLPANARADVKQILKAARDMLTIINRELLPASPNSTSSGAITPRSSKAGCHLLYIEDDPANIILVERILELRPGLIFKTATQGRLGIELAKTEQPKMILLDLNLPDINGADVLTALQSNPETSQIPVVVLSANAIPTQIERLLASGARNYLTKPFDLDHFLAVVDEWVQLANA